MNAAKFAHLKTCKIRDKVYHVAWRKPPGRNPDPTEEYVGQCDPPGKRKTVWLWPRQDPEDMVGTVIHEFCHSAFWDLEEGAIEEFERDVMRFLKRMKMKVSFE